MKHVLLAAAITVVGASVACSSKEHQAPAGPADAAGLVAPIEAAAPTEPTELHLTKDTSYRWGELQIAINPKNPKNIAYAVVGVGFTYACQKAHDPNCDVVQAKIPGLGFALQQPKGFFSMKDFTPIYVYTSFDQGTTWERVALPAHPIGLPDLTAQGDPSITVGPDGTFYVSWDANYWGTPDNALPSAGVAVTRSTDGGRTWSEPVITGTPVDGPKVTADLVTGTIYAASSTNRGPKSTGDPDAAVDPVNTRWVVSSTDGVHWTTPQPMGGQGGSTSAAHGMLATAITTSAQASLFSDANNALCGSAPCHGASAARPGGRRGARPRARAHGRARAAGGRSLRTVAVRRSGGVVAVRAVEAGVLAGKDDTRRGAPVRAAKRTLAPPAAHGGHQGQRHATRRARMARREPTRHTSSKTRADQSLKSSLMMRSMFSLGEGSDRQGRIGDDAARDQRAIRYIELFIPPDSTVVIGRLAERAPPDRVVCLRVLEVLSAQYTGLVRASGGRVDLVEDVLRARHGGRVLRFGPVELRRVRHGIIPKEVVLPRAAATCRTPAPNCRLSCVFIQHLSGVLLRVRAPESAIGCPSRPKGPAVSPSR